MSAKYLGEPACADTLSRINTRVAESAFRRVSFVLNGVATPSELARDRTVIPFNIGESMSLSDFTIDEAEFLASGSDLPTGTSRQLLRWILKWTGGHPLISDGPQLSRDRLVANSPWSEAAVDDVVTSLFRGPRDEPNLAFVDSMLTARLARGHSAADVVGVASGALGPLRGWYVADRASSGALECRQGVGREAGDP